MAQEISSGQNGAFNPMDPGGIARNIGEVLKNAPLPGLDLSLNQAGKLTDLAPKSERKPRNGKDKVGNTFREGLGQGFPFSPQSGAPHPNTKEKDVRLDMTKIDLKKLRAESLKAHAAAEGAKLIGYPLAGELLSRYLENSGRQMILSPSQTGYGWQPPGLTDVQNTDSPYDPGSVIRKELDTNVKAYFRDNPTATSVSVTGPYMRTWVRDRRSDADNALGSYYQRMAGEFVAKRDSSGNVTSIDGRIQWLGYDYYDFSKQGRDLTLPGGKTLVSREHLWLFAQPQVNLAKGFDIFIPGPLLRVRVNPRG